MSETIHVEKPTLLKQRSGLTMCGHSRADVLFAISPEELRRLVHTKGRRATEAQTCPRCYGLARPPKARKSK